jgi:hypothetical protein
MTAIKLWLVYNADSFSEADIEPQSVGGYHSAGAVVLAETEQQASDYLNELNEMYPNAYLTLGNFKPAVFREVKLERGVVLFCAGEC